MKSLSRHLQEQGASADLQKLFAVLAESVKDIAQILETGHMTGYSGTENIFGEQQLKLDVAANDLLVERLRTFPLVRVIASEELDDEIQCHPDGAYAVAYDPLDGSSLVDANFSVGSIFAVYKSNTFIGRTPGEQLAAAIALYGPRTTFIASIGSGTHEYTFQNNDFFLTQENMKVAEEGNYFAPGNLRACAKSAGYRNLVNFWLDRQYTLRYSGGMVPDVCHILKKGKGIFVYPGYSDAPNGKLRLLFECGPMAFLMEQAYGMASDGHISLLEKKIESITHRTPVFIGSKKEVEHALRVMEFETGTV